MYHITILYSTLKSCNLIIYLVIQSLRWYYSNTLRRYIMKMHRISLTISFYICVCVSV